MQKKLPIIVLSILFSSAVAGHAYPLPGRNERVALNMQGGAPSAGCSYASITPDGRFVAFQTGSTDIAPGDTNLNLDVYLRDRVTGTSERISLASDGTEPNAPSWDPSISGDGRFVAFRSEGSNVVPLDTNGTTDIFVRDRQTHLTERVSLTSSGAQASGGPSIAPAISRDARYVAFQSDATNLVAGDTNSATDIFVHDRQTGVTQRVSVGAGGVQANGNSFRPSLSGDGRIVFFHSDATNLVSGDTNAATDLFAYDRQTGVTERLDVATNGTEANDGTGPVARPAVSGDGRYVAYFSHASNLVPSDTNAPFEDAFVRDRVAGVTERVSVPSDGSEPVNGAFSISLGISDDGRYVTFEASARLAPEDTNNLTDIYVIDRRTGQAELISVTDEGSSANKDSFGAVIDGTGRYPAFPTFASNLDAIPSFGQFYVSLFVRDRGPQVGILRVTPSVVDCAVAVQGMARYGGVVIAEADDPADDGGTGANQLGAELTGASLTYRPEVGDVFARLRLASIPVITGAAGAPGVIYALTFKVDGVRYEVRATRIEPGTGTSPQFVLFRCQPDTNCSRAAVLKGGIGTTGNEVRFSLPLATIGAAEASALTDVQTSTGTGNVNTGIVSTLDQVALPSSVIPERRVTAGFAPAGTPESGVQFSVLAATSNAAYYAPLGALAPGTWDVWARACLGDECSALSAPVQITGACAPPPVPLVGVVSRKVHGGAGTFDVDLPLNGSGIECRSGGASNDYTLVFSFANTLTSVASASITSGTGAVSSSAIGSSDAHEYIVNLSSVANAQVITVTLANVTDSAGNSSPTLAVTMGVLVGDVNGNRSVSNTDVASVKAQVSSQVTASNFRHDVNANGVVSNTDVSATKAQVSTTLP